MRLLEKIKNFFSMLRGGNTLYYPGCLTKFVAKDLGERYKKILRKSGTDFIELKDLEVCCGSPVLNAGYKEDVKKLAEKNFKVFKEHAVKKIITSCPACFHMFSQEYPKLVDWNIKVEHITQSIAEAIKKGKLKLGKLGGKATYHDPCYLGRYNGVYEEPRGIVKTLGFDLVEMEFSRENSWCCGGGGGVTGNYPELVEMISLDRVQQAKETKSEILITTCPLCYLNFKRTVEKNKLGLTVYELSELI